MPEKIPTPGTGVVEREDVRVETPRRYKVLLHNDNYTTMEFVVMVLEDVFGRPLGEAKRIMLDVHENGTGVAGVYVKAVAEAKVSRVHQLARRHEFPLRCSMEPE